MKITEVSLVPNAPEHQQIKEGEKRMNLVKLKFLRNGEPSGREYTYISKSDVAVGDTVIVREAEEGKEAPKGVITAINVPESEVEKFRDKLKEIVGKAPVKESD